MEVDLNYLRGNISSVIKLVVFNRVEIKVMRKGVYIAKIVPPEIGEQNTDMVLMFKGGKPAVIKRTF